MIASGTKRIDEATGYDFPIARSDKLCLPQAPSWGPKFARMGR